MNECVCECQARTKLFVCALGGSGRASAAALSLSVVVPANQSASRTAAVVLIISGQSICSSTPSSFSPLASLHNFLPQLKMSSQMSCLPVCLSFDQQQQQQQQGDTKWHTAQIVPIWSIVMVAVVVAVVAVAASVLFHRGPHPAKTAAF